MKSYSEFATRQNVGIGEERFKLYLYYAIYRTKLPTSKHLTEFLSALSNTLQVTQLHMVVLNGLGILSGHIDSMIYTVNNFGVAAEELLAEWEVSDDTINKITDYYKNYGGMRQMAFKMGIAKIVDDIRYREALLALTTDIRNDLHRLKKLSVSVPNKFPHLSAIIDDITAL